ncbi:unnamed protein product, partial [Rotaria sp. Silwood2]
MGIFIRDLYRNIEKLYSEQSNSSYGPATTITAYRGKTMTKQDFDSKIKQGGLISFNNFLLTSGDRNAAIRFIKEGHAFTNIENKIGVLFTMKVDRSTSSAAFVRIDN